MQVASQTKWKKKKSSEYSVFSDSHWENADLSGFLWEANAVSFWNVNFKCCDPKKEGGR